MEPDANWLHLDCQIMCKPLWSEWPIFCEIWVIVGYIQTKVVDNNYYSRVRAAFAIMDIHSELPNERQEHIKNYIVYDIYNPTFAYFFEYSYEHD